jgi:Ni,Fe-hydrogenase maturation factor
MEGDVEQGAQKVLISARSITDGSTVADGTIDPATQRLRVDALFAGAVEVIISEANDSILIYGQDAGAVNRAIRTDNVGRPEINLHDGVGTPITSTVVGPDTGIDVNIIGGVTLEVNLDLADDEVMIGTITAGGVRQLTKGVDDGGGRNRIAISQDGVTLDIEGPDADGAAATGDPVQVGGVDGGGLVQALSTDANGRANVNVVDALPAGGNNIGDVDVASGPTGAAALEAQGTAADGVAAVGNPVQIGGVDGGGLAQALSTDVNGRANVNVVDELPAGTNNIGDVDIASGPTGAAALEAQGTAADGAAAVGNPVQIGGVDGGGLAQALSTDAKGRANVNVVDALPAGGNNIGDVDVASVIPGTGATNLGKAEDAVHADGDVGVMPLSVRRDADTPMAADGDYAPIQTDADGKVKVAGEVSTAPLTWAAPTFATVGVASGAALAANANRKGAVFVNDSANLIYLGIGAAASVGRGIRLNRQGGSYEMNATNLSTQVVNAIATGAGSNLCVHEAT